MTLKYSYILRDYFYDLKNICKEKFLLFIVVIFSIIPFISMFSERGFFDISEKSVYLIPYWFSYISICSHRLSLPSMMYLVPLNSGDREIYIRKMAVCKAVVPAVFMIVFDLIFSFFIEFTVWTAALQLVSVVLPCINAAINFEMYRKNKMTLVSMLYLAEPMVAIMYFAYPATEDTAYMPFIMLLIFNIIAFCFTVRDWPKLRKFYSCYENTNAGSEKK